MNVWNFGVQAWISVVNTGCDSEVEFEKLKRGSSSSVQSLQCGNVQFHFCVQSYIARANEMSWNNKKKKIKMRLHFFWKGGSVLCHGAGNFCTMYEQLLNIRKCSDWLFSGIVPAIFSRNWTCKCT